MYPPILITEKPAIESTVLVRRISLSFCATMVLGISLCVLYLCGALREPADLIAIALPDPPAPLSETAASEPAREISGKKSLPLKLEVIATQDAWVEVDTDGHTKYKRLVRVDETLSIEAFQRIRMMTGNAGGLDLRFNGQPVAATGAKRRIRTLEFTNTGILEVNSGNS